ncbi:hypothetical protein LIER_43954 [Lithospermum erythrorhizon]|uniref:Uncharacterized protein n=1 Tax=Lithospermum erythrorhizon TaxID=34254 RepID=A0AAV3RHF3_LITER
MTILKAKDSSMPEVEVRSVDLAKEWHKANRGKEKTDIQIINPRPEENLADILFKTKRCSGCEEEITNEVVIGITTDPFPRWTTSLVYKGNRTVIQGSKIKTKNGESEERDDTIFYGQIEEN